MGGLKLDRSPNWVKHAEELQFIGRGRTGCETQVVTDKVRVKSKDKTGKASQKFETFGFRSSTGADAVSANMI